SLKDLPIDAFVFTGHKGLFGISGTGGFYLRDQEAIEPIRFRVREQIFSHYYILEKCQKDLKQEHIIIQALRHSQQELHF
ncbi:MAG TPA: hypothetical protein O0W81_03435, partial [Methanocorpusculum sp.]|nr:hypothetical protein [Methanocorpusculum sp.]